MVDLWYIWIIRYIFDVNSFEKPFYFANNYIFKGKEQSADDLNQVVDKCIELMDINKDEMITRQMFKNKALIIVEFKQVIENPNL